MEYFFFMQEKHLEELILKGYKYLKPKDKNLYRAQLLLDQKHKCKICSKDLTNEKNQNRAMDHDHKSKFVRGVLCFSCNTVLGKIERSGFGIDWLIWAAEYLRNDNLEIIYPEKITGKRKTKKIEMKKLINENLWKPNN
jgi:hypothetical protein